jgi:hypothetical protein
MRHKAQNQAIDEMMERHDLLSIQQLQCHKERRLHVLQCYEAMFLLDSL